MSEPGFLLTETGNRPPVLTSMPSGLRRSRTAQGLSALSALSLYMHLNQGAGGARVSFLIWQRYLVSFKEIVLYFMSCYILQHINLCTNIQTVSIF